MTTEYFLQSELKKHGFAASSQKKHRTRWVEMVEAGKRPASLLARDLSVDGDRKQMLLDATAGLVWSTDFVIRGDGRSVDQKWESRHKRQIRNWLHQSMSAPLSSSPIARAVLSKRMKALYADVDLEAVVAEVATPAHYRDTVLRPFLEELRSQVVSANSDPDAPFSVALMQAQVEEHENLVNLAFRVLDASQFSEFLVRRFTTRLESVFGSSNPIAKRRALGTHLGTWLLKTRSDLPVHVASGFAAWAGQSADIRDYRYTADLAAHNRKQFRPYVEHAPALVEQIEHLMHELLAPAGRFEPGRSEAITE